MNSTQVSARFAAYVWYLNLRAGKRSAEEDAARFARKNWAKFLPCAHEGLGRLLIRLAKVRKRVRAGRPTLCEVAGR